MDAKWKWIFLVVSTLQFYIATNNVGVDAVTITERGSAGSIVLKDGNRVLTVDIGSSITLQCVTRDQSTGVWLGPNGGISYGNSLLHTDTAKYSISVDSSSIHILAIQSLTQLDEGEYRCQSGSDFDSIQLIVSLPATPVPQVSNEPVITKREGPGNIVEKDGISELRVDNGDNIALQCTVAVGVHTSWLLRTPAHVTSTISSGSTLFPSIDTDKFDIEVQDRGTTIDHILRIRSLTLLDEAQYECKTLHDEGQGRFAAFSESIQLYVSTPPTISSITGLQNANEGDAVNLRCVVEGSPDPTIMWRRVSSNIKLPNGMTGDHYLGSELNINAITLEDRGEYECIASNGVPNSETVVKQTTFIRMEYGPIVRAVVDETGIVDVPSGDPATLSCRASSYPKVDSSSVEWYFEGVILSDIENFADKWDWVYFELSDRDDPYQETVLSQLNVYEVKSATAGQYTCSFTNTQDVGEASMKLQNTETEPSGGSLIKKTITTDSGLRITSVVPLSSTSIQVEWELSQNSATVDSYRLEIVDSNDDPITVLDIQPDAIPYTVNELQPDTVYKVAVQPFIAGAYGPRTDFISVRTLGDSECVSIKPRRYNISDIGSPCLFRGWVDVQGQGAANDYCRVVSEGGPQFLSCALAGALEDHVYTSPNASVDWFDAGHMDTWYMIDQDGDGRDDYCRCVGTPPNTVTSCMKAGDTGFLGHDDFQVLASTGCHYSKVNPFLGVQ